MVKFPNDDGMYPDNWLFSKCNWFNCWSFPKLSERIPDSLLLEASNDCRYCKFYKQGGISPVISLLKNCKYTSMEKLHMIVGKVPEKLFPPNSNACNMVAFAKEETKSKSSGREFPRKLLSSTRR